jgi:hypothetical protein
MKKFGSGMENNRIRDPRSGINIPDPQHCLKQEDLGLGNINYTLATRGPGGPEPGDSEAREEADERTEETSRRFGVRKRSAPLAGVGGAPPDTFTTRLMELRLGAEKRWCCCCCSGVGTGGKASVLDIACGSQRKSETFTFV